MSRARTIIAVASGRRAKWAWWSSGWSSWPWPDKLTGAEKTDSSSWLPAGAESTKVLALRSRFQSPDIFTAVVVYARASGLTSADRAKAKADAKAVRPGDRRRAGPGHRAGLGPERPGDRDARAGQPGLEGLGRRVGRGD